MSEDQEVDLADKVERLAGQLAKLQDVQERIADGLKNTIYHLRRHLNGEIEAPECARRLSEIKEELP